MLNLRNAITLPLAILSFFFNLFQTSCKFVVDVLREFQDQKAEALSLKHKMDHEVKTYKEWLELAHRLDELKGIDIWKKVNESDKYDYMGTEDRMFKLKELMISKDLHGMEWSLRTQLHRNICGISNPVLYKNCSVGTKELIENYIDQVCEMLDYIKDAPTNDAQELIDKFYFFRDTSHSFGRTALLLSGGASLGMYHFGVAKALFEENLLPKIISGSSAGAIVASYLCMHSDDEMPHCFNPSRFNLDMFGGGCGVSQQFRHSAIRKILRFMRSGVLMDISKLQQCLRDNIGDVTFEEAYKKSGRILNITISSNQKFSMGPSLLNYLTSPHVLVWSAAAASCCVPGVYKPVSLMAKDRRGHIINYHASGVQFSDGSIYADLPVERLSELFNVNNLIVSQVNPYVIPFLNANNIDTEEKGTVFGKIKHFLFQESKHRLLQMFEYNLVPKRLKFLERLLTQTYTGGITILPADFEVKNYTRLLTNPTIPEIQNCLEQGARRTFVRMSIIKNRCRIEMQLQDCLSAIKKQMVSDQVFCYKNGVMAAEDVAVESSGDLVRRTNALTSSVSIPSFNILDIYEEE
ncbi:triacylglycerol lipase SDP1 [Acrasis kona]|uniref:Triacylglycerol lipase SDP1 n=1 Tax=Acrasis kona TaxID=1008807 RepID=A0AAW2ZRB9_9EUKA